MTLRPPYPMEFGSRIRHMADQASVGSFISGRLMWDFLGDVNGLGWGAALGFRFTW